MATTTIHVPDDLLVDIDRVASAAGVSRNRFVIQACRQAVNRHLGDWPEEFFQQVLSAPDRELLDQATREMELGISSSRRSRGALAL